MSEVSDHKQDDLLTEYGTATTAYLLMAMSIDSLERKNRKLEAENAMLRELENIRILQVKHCEDLDAENTNLRELVRRYVEYTSQDRCEGCVFKSRCNDGEVDDCCQLAEIRGLARELGIKVDECMGQL